MAIRDVPRSHVIAFALSHCRLTGGEMESKVDATASPAARHWARLGTRPLPLRW